MGSDTPTGGAVGRGDAALRSVVGEFPGPGPGKRAMDAAAGGEAGVETGERSVAVDGRRP